jgi:hypothetical protein
MMLKPKCTKWLTTAMVVAWLEEKQIVELLFGKGVHFELISRSKDILRVLSEYRRFGEEHINLMWSAAVGKGKQERITDTIYDLFDHLVKDLEPELVAFLVQKIRDTRVFDVKTLNLMKTLTMHQLLEDDDNVRARTLLRSTLLSSSPVPSRPDVCTRCVVTGALHRWAAALLGHHPGRPLHLS